MAISGVSGSTQQQPTKQVNNITEDMQQVQAAPQDPTQAQQTQQVNATRTDSDGDTDGSKGYSKDPAPAQQTLTAPWVGRNINISG